MKRRIKLSELKSILEASDIFYIIVQVSGRRTIKLDEFDTLEEAEENLEYYKDRAGVGSEVEIRRMDKTDADDMAEYIYLQGQNDL